MKHLSLICLAALAPTFVMANIVPTSTSISVAEPYVWTYNLQLSQDQNVFPGPAPAGSSVSSTDLNSGSLFTVYDFDGYIAGSCSGPSGWVCMEQSIGITPTDVSPTDDPGILNLTWVYTSGPMLEGIAGGLDLGNFTAQSIYNTITTVSFASRGVRNDGELAGTIGDNAGQTFAPGPLGTPIPEPGSLALAGLGLLGLCLVRRRKGA